MNDDLRRFINTLRFSRDYVLLDSNLLLLLAIGSLGEEQLYQCSRLSDYEMEDYNLLFEIVKGLEHLTTPSILAEVSNLIEGGEAHIKSSRLLKLRQITSDSQEQLLTSLEMMGTPAFTKLGLTDSSVIELCIEDAFVITNDGPLYGFLSNYELPALYFDDVR